MTSHPHSATAIDPGFGERLRQARLAAGMGVEDVATRLKMSVRVVESLEAEDWTRLGATVFVRGQLRSYSRLVGVPVDLMGFAQGSAPIEPARLEPRSFVPPMQRLAEQVARRMVYVVITAAIAVPVWLATRPHLGVAEQDAIALDVPAGTPPIGPVPVAPRREPVVVASMAPVPKRQEAPALSLLLREDAWVQVTAPDGRMLEESLLRAGERRSYGPGEVASLVLGNGTAVEVRHRGQVQDLAPYLRANVARFAVSSDGSPTAPAR